MGVLPARRAWTISARILTAISSGVTAPMSSPAGAFRRPMRSAASEAVGGPPWGPEILDDGRGAAAAGEEPHVPGARHEDAFQHVFVGGAVRRHHDRGPWS